MSGREEREERFTPGPWRAQVVCNLHPFLNTNNCVVFSEVERGGIVTSIPYGKDEPERAANAHLVAAAPEMYELLDELRYWFCEGVPEHLNKETTGMKITDVLKKARGEHE